MQRRTRQAYDSATASAADGRQLKTTIAALLLVLAGAASACAATETVKSTPGVPTANSQPEAVPAEAAPPGEPRDVEFVLPERAGPRRSTTGSVPHIQTDAEPVAAVDSELRRRVFLLPGIADEPSDRSLPGARGLAVTDDLDLARPDVIAGSSEFAHIHPDGSLHVWLPVDRAQEVHDQKWGELHPWVERDGFWGGVVMLYTPETPEELDVVVRLIAEAYNFVVGADIDPSDLA